MFLSPVLVVNVMKCTEMTFERLVFKLKQPHYLLSNLVSSVFWQSQNFALHAESIIMMRSTEKVIWVTTNGIVLLTSRSERTGVHGVNRRFDFFCWVRKMVDNIIASVCCLHHASKIILIIVTFIITILCCFTAYERGIR